MGSSRKPAPADKTETNRLLVVRRPDDDSAARVARIRDETARERVATTAELKGRALEKASNGLMFAVSYAAVVLTVLYGFAKTHDRGETAALALTIAIITVRVWAAIGESRRKGE